MSLDFSRTEHDKWKGATDCSESSQKLRWKAPPIFITVPLPHSGRLIWRAFISFISSLPSATGVGCQSRIFFPRPPILLDMTDSLLGLLTTGPSTSHLVIMKNTLSLATGLSLELHYQQPPSQDFILVVLPLSSN